MLSMVSRINCRAQRNEFFTDKRYKLLRKWPDMRVTILQIIFPLLALTSFINPFYGVIYYSFISVIRPEQLTYGNNRIPAVFATAILCLVLSCILKKENLLNAVRQNFFIYFCCFIAALYISTYSSGYTDFSERQGSIYYLQQLPQILAFCICLFAVLTRLDDNQFQTYLKAIVFFFLFMGGWGIEQYFRGNTLVERLFGSAITDRCAITGVYILYFPLAVYFAQKKEKVLKLFGLISMAVFFAMVILSQSRAGFLGFGLLILVMFIHSRRKVVFATYVILLLLVGLAFVPESYYDRVKDIQMQDIEGNEISDNSSASRLLLWRIGLKMFTDNPAIGVGNLNFSRASSRYAGEVEGAVDQTLYSYTFGPDGRSRLTHTHNTFLNILAEGGLASAIPFYLLILIPLWRGYRLNRRLSHDGNDRLELINLLNTGIIGFLVTAFFTNMLLLDYLYWNLSVSYFLSVDLENNPVNKEE